MSENGLLVRKIKEGTVIDHIPAGRALAVLKILRIRGDEGIRVSLLMNAESKKMGSKDIVKVENRELKGQEVDLISLIAPQATINIVKDYKVVEKRKLVTPKMVRGVLKCWNPTCITNNDPEAVSRFTLISEKPLLLKCNYCYSYTMEEQVFQQILGE
jgi:aspartate carbamoyltransferase regulatory subunit